MRGRVVAFSFLLALCPDLSAAVAAAEATLRDGCDEGASLVATVPAGTAVEVRYALANGGPGGCYKVAVKLDETVREGFLAGPSLAGLDTFERERATASDVNLPRVLQSQMDALKRTITPAVGDRSLARAIQLLETQRPGEALSALQDVLQTRPQDAQVLALAGLAAHRADDLPRAIAYLRSSLQLRPQPGLQQVLARLEREAAADRSAEKVYGTRFLLRYDNTAVDSETARQMVTTLEQEYSRISAVLGCRTDERIVTIVQTPAAYRQGADVAEWSGGHFDGKIHVPVSDGRTVTPRLRQVFAHEIVHACLSGLGTWPSWLHEGLAQRLSGEGPAAADIPVIRAMARGNRLPRLGMLRQDWSRMSPYHAQLAYRYAAVAALTMEEAYQSVGLANLLRNPTLLAQATEQVDRVLSQP